MALEPELDVVEVSNSASAALGLRWYELSYSESGRKAFGVLEVDADGRGTISIVGTMEKNLLGPAVVRQLLRSLGMQVPGLRLIVSERTTGARRDNPNSVYATIRFGH